VLGYAGEDSLWMQAVHLGMQHPDPRIQEIANNYGRVRRQWLYNVVDLSNPTTHYGQDGIMRPFILGAGSTLQKDIGILADTRGGISKLVHPISGRPLRYMKKKTGPEEMNVEYGVLDLDPAPLNQYFFPVMEKLWDLEAQTKAAMPEEMMRAIQEIGLPMPATGQSFGQVPQSYNPNPAPAWGNPYAQPQQAPPQYGAPPPPPPYAQPMQGQQQQMPFVPPPPPQMVPQFAPPPPPPPVSGQPSMGNMPPPPPPMGQFPQQMAPPQLAPPPVSSQPGPSGYVANPGAQPPAPPSMPPPNMAPPPQMTGVGNPPF